MTIVCAEPGCGKTMEIISFQRGAPHWVEFAEEQTELTTGERTYRRLHYCPAHIGSVARLPSEPIPG